MGQFELVVLEENESCETLTLVGKTGRFGDALLEELECRHSLFDAQTWPLAQQPPPNVAGQEKNPDLQVTDVVVLPPMTTVRVVVLPLNVTVVVVTDTVTTVPEVIWLVELTRVVLVVVPPVWVTVLVP